MRLVLLSPLKTLFDGEIDSVTIPGTKGQFTVLPHHAPLITSIEKGRLTYKTKDAEQYVEIGEGFAEIKNNVVYVCVEKVTVE